MQLVHHVVEMVNLAYDTAERGLWRQGVKRTSVTELTEQIAREEIVVAERDGRIVGHVSSGNYGHALGGAIGLGYVPCAPGEDAATLLASTYAIDVAGHVCLAEASLAPMYDPRGERVKG